jgi:hypothetical protein
VGAPGPTTHSRERRRFLIRFKPAPWAGVFIGGSVSVETLFRLKADFAEEVSGLGILVPGADCGISGNGPDGSGYVPRARVPAFDDAIPTACREAGELPFRGVVVPGLLP